MFFNDNETIVDLIQYEPVAKSVVDLLDKARGHPITIGLHGDWGAGKSSVLAMVQRELEADKKTLCLRFNGWTFQGFEDAKLVMLEDIVGAVKTRQSPTSALAETAGRLFRRIDWLKAVKHLGGAALALKTGIILPEQAAVVTGFVTKLVAGELPVGEVPAEVLEQAKGLLKPAEQANVPREIQSFRADFATLLKEADVERLVVLVDDLDRCLPATIIETLEAIRLFLFVDKSAFVIAVDEAMVEYAVRQHFPDLPGGVAAGGYARSYLEKLIQVPFRIPALGPAETKTYIALLLLEKAVDPDEFALFVTAARDSMVRPWTSEGLTSALTKSIAVKKPGEVEAAFQLSRQLARLLNDGANGNPRQIKRFLNSLLLRESIAEARGFKKDLERPMLAKIMLLERFASTQYQELVKAVGADKAGKLPDLAALEKSVREKKSEPDSAKPFGSWLKEDRVVEWLELDPPIGEVDLRPYMFVTRDKRAFSGAAGLPEILLGLVDRLSAGAFVVAGEAEAVAKLNASDARLTFFEISERLAAVEDWKSRPVALDGMVALAKAHPTLQQELVDFLSRRSVKSLGAWATAGWDSALTDTGAKATFAKLLKSWSEQSENPGLSKAAGTKLKK
jgi:predicted KAP-like P-loop ATPase